MCSEWRFIRAFQTKPSFLRKVSHATGSTKHPRCPCFMCFMNMKPPGSKNKHVCKQKSQRKQVKIREVTCWSHLLTFYCPVPACSRVAKNPSSGGLAIEEFKRLQAGWNMLRKFIYTDYTLQKYGFVRLQTEPCSKFTCWIWKNENDLIVRKLQETLECGSHTNMLAHKPQESDLKELFSALDMDFSGTELWLQSNSTELGFHWNAMRPGQQLGQLLRLDISQQRPRVPIFLRSNGPALLVLILADLEASSPFIWLNDLYTAEPCQAFVYAR
jgi:hypothetical protein